MNLKKLFGLQTEEEVYVETIMQSSQVQRVLQQLWTKAPLNAYDEWKKHGLAETCALIRQHLGHVARTEEIHMYCLPVWLLAYYWFADLVMSLQEQISSLQEWIETLSNNHQEELEELEETHASELEELEESHRTEMEKLKAEHKRQYADYVRRVEDAHQREAQELIQLRQQKEILSGAVGRQYSEIQKLRRSMEELTRPKPEELPEEEESAKPVEAVEVEAEPTPVPEPKLKPVFSSIAERNAAIVKYYTTHSDAETAEKYGVSEATVRKAASNAGYSKKRSVKDSEKAAEAV